MRSEHISIKTDLDVFAIRRAARGMATDLGFDVVERTAIETAVAELASNVLRHAGGGTITLRPLKSPAAGLELRCEDDGPGIADVGAALRGTDRSPGGLGIGLGGVQRLMDELEIHSRPGAGTRITARKWTSGERGSKAAREQGSGAATIENRKSKIENPQEQTWDLQVATWQVQVAVASRPAQGMEASGDAWLVREDSSRLLIALIDGLGHGEAAARAAQQATAHIEGTLAKVREQLPAGGGLRPQQIGHLPGSWQPSQGWLTELIQGCHDELKGTRGAVLGLALLEPGGGMLTYAGIGNTGIRVAGGTPVHPISLSGIVGYTMRRVREETFACAPGDVIVMYTDGISERFDLPTLLRQTPDAQELAKRLVTEYGREHDDATVIAVSVGSMQ